MHRYFDPETVGLDFEGMCSDLESAPEGSIIVLHGKLTQYTQTACCRVDQKHNRFLALITDRSGLRFPGMLHGLLLHVLFAWSS